MKQWKHYMADQEVEDHEYIPLITPEDEEQMDKRLIAAGCICSVNRWFYGD